MSRLLRFMLSAAVVGLLSTQPGVAAFAAFACIEGVKGDATAVGFNDCIHVEEFHHLVTGAGAATHEPVVFVKRRYETSTVDLFRLLAGPETFIADFKFTVSQAGPQEIYCVIRLEGASVAAIEPWWRGGLDGDDQHERIRLNYEQMTVEYFPIGPPALPEKAGPVTLARPGSEGAR